MEKMNGKLLVLFSLVCWLAAGCTTYSSAASPQATAIPSAHPRSAPTVIHPPTQLDTSAAPAETQPASAWEAAKSCVTVYASRPDTYRLTGVVAVRSLRSNVLGLEMSLLDLSDGALTEIPTPNPVDDASVSPDRKTLAYLHFNTRSSKWELTLLDAKGHVRKTAWSSTEYFGFQGWVNDHQVVVLRAPYFIVVDILRNSSIRFSPSDFPNFNPSYSYFSGDFDPSLMRAFYKSGKIYLLDLNTSTIIAQIDDSYDRVPIVEWQPSGERAAIVAPAYNTPPGSPDEIFIVEADGQSRQLTHLYDTFGPTGNIQSLSWSPDGAKIALWLPDGKGSDTLMVADAATGDVTNYCVLNDRASHFPTGLAAPLWSPDGKYLLVENRYSEDANRLLVLDLQNKVAFPIAENANPVGWMTKEP